MDWPASEEAGPRSEGVKRTQCNIMEDGRTYRQWRRRMSALNKKGAASQEQSDVQQSTSRAAALGQARTICCMRARACDYEWALAHARWYCTH